jgi:23S rRNA (uracil1939-C5)-methyltransferase
VLVGRALRLLDVQPDERVIDWFCGLGNFTLPLATQRARGAGHRGQRDPGAARSRDNAARNGLAERTQL